MLPDSAPRVDTLGLTARFHLAMIATNLTNITQISTLDSKLLRIIKLLSSHEVDINILQNFELKILNPKTAKFNQAVESLVETASLLSIVLLYYS